MKYRVTGMSCAACSATVEKTVNRLEGVEKCTVSLLTETMTVEGEYNEQQLIDAVGKAGYGVVLFGQDDAGNDRSDSGEVSYEIKILKNRLIYSSVFLIALMYAAMGHNMFGFPLPTFFENNPTATALVQLILAACVLIINKKFFINGFKSFLRGSPNMDTLVALGSSVSYIYSIGVTFVMISSPDRAGHLLHRLYYESSAMIVVLITVGKLLESISKGETANALKSLIKLVPKNATVIIDGKEMSVSVEQVKKGDLFIVKPGESIAFDGYVVDGTSSVNEAAITGESLPVDKQGGDSVTAGTVNMSGFLVCRASSVGEDTTLAKIIKTVSEASASKAPIARVADKVSGIFVPIVMSIAIITVVVWLILGKEFGFALVRGISVLVISCPCALGLATPVAIMVGNGVGAKNGILFKTAEALENTGRITVVALDKTGTITNGQPVITDICPAENIKQEELLTVAYSLEKKSEHPLAKAIVAYSQENLVELISVNDFEISAGNGLFAKYGEKNIYGGNRRFVEQYAESDLYLSGLAERLSDEGKTPMYFAVDSKILGLIAVADGVKTDSKQAISEFKKMGITTVMLTGDNERTANAIGRQVGVDKIISGLLPEEKAKNIRELGKLGKVAMIGDGINDSPALASADVGIAIGAGTDVAIDSADVVLMKSVLTDGVNAVKIGRATLRNIHENLFWAFIYNSIGIPVAAGVFISLFGWELTPMLGAMAMSLSSFCVVTNALRLNLVKLHILDNTRADSKRMVLHVKGMMCEHCENHVRTALLNVSGVKSAEADHKNGIVTVYLYSPVDEEQLKKTVEAEGYKVKRIVKEGI